MFFFFIKSEQVNVQASKVNWLMVSQKNQRVVHVTSFLKAESIRLVPLADQTLRHIRVEALHFLVVKHATAERFRGAGGHEVLRVPARFLCPRASFLDELGPDVQSALIPAEVNAYVLSLVFATTFDSVEAPAQAPGFAESRARDYLILGQAFLELRAPFAPDVLLSKLLATLLFEAPKRSSSIFPLGAGNLILGRHVGPALFRSWIPMTRPVDTITVVLRHSELVQELIPQLVAFERAVAGEGRAGRFGAEIQLLIPQAGIAHVIQFCAVFNASFLIPIVVSAALAFRWRSGREAGRE